MSRNSNIQDQPLAGAEVIAGYVKRLDNSPGVYRMIDKQGVVLYVGKANNLKKRVTAYTRLKGHSNRIARMIKATVSMEFITTKSETEALLLESNLIRRFKPYYNVLLRDDRSFPYILIRVNDQAAQLTKFRGARTQKGDYFGPFANPGSVNRTISVLQRAFLLRSCSDSFYANRRRPCLLYQIKRCSAPCTGEISKSDYARLVAEAKDFLNGKSDTVKNRLIAAMEQASQRFKFEQAAELRDRIAAINQIQASQDINVQGISQADVFAIVENGDRSAIEVFFFRSGQNWGNRVYYPRDSSGVHSAGQILESFISQFYNNKPVPGQVIVSQPLPDGDLLAAALSIKAGVKVRVTCPQRGKLRRVIDHAIANAESALARHMADQANNKNLLDELKQRLGLARAIKRIEIYDNSHIQGNNAVGAMVVFGLDGFVKSQYRVFNIKSQTITPGDDLAMMREVLSRRFKKLVDVIKRDAAIDTDNSNLLPDLVIIDGGNEQLKVAIQVAQELGVDSDIAIISVAKGQDRDAGREQFFVPGKKPFRLPHRDSVLYFVQRLRDEAHRFAIGRHRAKRQKNISKSMLDAVPGIGAARKKSLLSHFGSARAVKHASPQDLARIPGISKAMAQQVYDYFHDER